MNLKKELHKWIASSEYGTIDEKSMVLEMLGPALNQPELSRPAVEKMNEGIVVQSTNNMASIGWRLTGARKWNMYTKHSIIQPQGNFEVILFQVGYKPLVTKFNE